MLQFKLIKYSNGNKNGTSLLEDLHYFAYSQIRLKTVCSNYKDVLEECKYEGKFLVYTDADGNWNK